jgi:cation diffusion facilitator CzcD-associated flavoprotein CzcO
LPRSQSLSYGGLIFDQAERHADPGDPLEAIVVGAGIGGICMAIKLREAGIERFAVLEREAEIGGAWAANTYPGCACDVASHLYSFSFAPNPGWSRSFSPQGEILAYLEGCADRFGVRSKVRLSAAVTSAVYDEEAALWRVEVNGAETLTARVLVLAKGLLSRPHLPDLPGLGAFAGPVFHSAAWDHGFDPRGKRVAVIGTGASAIQFVPRIAPLTARLDLYQRTPPWVLPKADRALTRFEQRVFRRVPAAQRAVRRAIYWGLETRAVSFTVSPRLGKAFELLGRAHIRSQVTDRRLRRLVTPDYAMGCKRVLISNDYYPALGRDDVDLIVDPIERVTERGVVGADGREREVDAIVFGTGFRPFDLGPIAIIGRGGRRLDRSWADSPQAHRGTTVAEFPNLFLLVGPNTGLGHSSMIFMIESQVRYVIDALRVMRERGLRSVEVRTEAQARWNRRLRARLDRTVWSSGCSSWYLDRDGRNPTMWPSFSFVFRRRTRRFEAEEYHLDRRVRERAAA